MCMSNIEKKIEFIDLLQKSIEKNVFVKLSLSNYKGTDVNLKNIYLKKIVIKNEEKLSFTYRYKTKDIVKNYSFIEAFDIVAKIIENDFRIASLLTTEHDYVYENVNNKKYVLRTNAPSLTKLPSLDHDRKKKRKISNAGEKKYLSLLSVTDENGKVLAKSQDKFKQINHYIEILSSLLKDLPTGRKLKVADMGSGKGYLTFALYDYLTNALKLNVDITGVEFRSELVELCNDIAKDSKFEQLKFEEGSIEDYNCGDLDVLIALHACNTATDDAIAKGIKSNAELIVVAPCCHHQVRVEIEKSNKENAFSQIVKHGIFLERQAELITDGIRALVLEYYGYQTKVVEFIADAHTHKNIMIIAQKNKNKKLNDEKILDDINAIKNQFGIEYHQLEKNLDINK